jgi:outer membrane protein OmpA-like peptidoglycan-associated protein
MSKKHQKNNKIKKKDVSLKSTEKNNDIKETKSQNESIDIHYPAHKSSGNFDKNIIIVIICFVIIFSIVIIEKNYYKKNIKENEDINLTSNSGIATELVTQTATEHEKMTEEPKAIEKKQLETTKIIQPKQTNKINIETNDEEPMFTIEPLKEEPVDDQLITTTDMSSQESSEIILDFTSDYKFTQEHKSYLIEKLDISKKLGHSNNVIIYGYVNAAKKEETNIKQSLELANSVADYLAKNGYIPVSVQGRGSEDLEDTNPIRKVEIQLLQYR